MGRVINTNNPGKRRNHHMRTIAELMRLLTSRNSVDDDVKDMLAAIVFLLREVNATVEESITAWEKRGYWKKADDFQNKWWWASNLALDIEKTLQQENWENIPNILLKIYPHVSAIEIKSITRNSDAWAGAHHRLMNQDNAGDS
ncbi:hypothetical protein MASR2M15_13910 [Anaerolineales bacterium]